MFMFRICWQTGFFTLYSFICILIYICCSILPHTHQSSNSVRISGGALSSVYLDVVVDKMKLVNLANTTGRQYKSCLIENIRNI